MCGCRWAWAVNNRRTTDFRFMKSGVSGKALPVFAWGYSPRSRPEAKPRMYLKCPLNLPDEIPD